MILKNKLLIFLVITSLNTVAHAADVSENIIRSGLVTFDDGKTMDANCDILSWFSPIIRSQIKDNEGNTGAVHIPNVNNVTDTANTFEQLNTLMEKAYKKPWKEVSEIRDHILQNYSINELKDIIILAHFLEIKGLGIINHTMARVLEPNNLKEYAPDLNLFDDFLSDMKPLMAYVIQSHPKLKNLFNSIVPQKKLIIENYDQKCFFGHGTPTTDPIWTKSDSAVTAMAFSPDGKRLACSCSSQSINIWNSMTGGLEAREIFASWKDPVNSLAYSPDGRYIAVSGSSGDNNVMLLNIGASKERPDIGDMGRDSQAFMIPFDEPANALAYSPAVNILAFCSSSKIVKAQGFETIGTTNIVSASVLNFDNVKTLAFSPDGKYLAAGSKDGKLYIISTTSNTCVKVIGGYEGSINSVVFSYDGKYLATGSDDKTVALWNTSSWNGKILYRHGDIVNSVAFSPNGQFLVSGSDDKKISVWDLMNNRSHTIFDNPNPVKIVSFSPDGKLASASTGSTITFWKILDQLPLKLLLLIAFISENSNDLSIYADKIKEEIQPLLASVNDTETKALLAEYFNDKLSSNQDDPS